MVLQLKHVRKFGNKMMNVLGDLLIFHARFVGLVLGKKTPGKLPLLETASAKTLCIALEIDILNLAKKRVFLLTWRL